MISGCQGVCSRRFNVGTKDLCVECHVGAGERRSCRQNLQAPAGGGFERGGKISQSFVDLSTGQPNASSLVQQHILGPGGRASPGCSEGPAGEPTGGLPVASRQFERPQIAVGEPQSFRIEQVLQTVGLRERLPSVSQLPRGQPLLAEVIPNQSFRSGIHVGTRGLDPIGIESICPVVPEQGV